MADNNLKYLSLLLVFMSILIMSNVYALDSLGTFEKGETVNITQVCSDATYVNISSINYPNSTRAVMNVEMVSSGSGGYYYAFNETDKIGRYDVVGISDGCQNTFATYFEITPNGKVSNIQTALIQILIILFFIGLIYGVYFMNSKIDFEKWNASLFEKYAKRNLLKFVIGSMCYSVMKQSFLIYYLLGLPIMVSIADLTYTYNLTDLSAIISAITMIYAVGIIVVGLIFFGYVQEWLMDLFDKMHKQEWGIE